MGFTYSNKLFGGTGSGGSGGISGLTTGYVPKATSPTTIGDSGIAESGNTYSLGANKSGTNTAPDGKTIVGNLGTGNATSGALIFQTGVPQASGTTQHVPATALTLTNSGTGGTSAPQALFAAGVATTPSLSGANDTNTGFYWEGGDVIAASFGGSKKLHLFGTGIWLPMNDAVLSAGTTQDRWLTWPAAATLQLGAANAASPVAQVLRPQGATGTNAAAAATFTIETPRGTGKGAPGKLSFVAAQVGASGSAEHAVTERLAIKELTVSLPGLPEYADNAAAIGGGLDAGDVYRTSTGVLMVTY